jgi:hypothetical protein
MQALSGGNILKRISHKTISIFDVISATYKVAGYKQPSIVLITVWLYNYAAK